MADNSVVTSRYDGHGLLTAQWGSQTYARFYDYNVYDELIELRTYQDLAFGTEPLASTTGFASTKWNYHAPTGLLLDKRDADSKGCDYGYDTAGRLLTRDSARLGADDTASIRSSYSYTEWGELDTVAYSNDPTQTRPLDYDYDRIGRLTGVTLAAETPLRAGRSLKTVCLLYTSPSPRDRG